MLHPTFILSVELSCCRDSLISGEEVNVTKVVDYVIYKPWLGGVYAEYTTRGRGQRKFAAEINPERSEGFIEAANFR